MEGEEAKNLYKKGTELKD